MYTTVKKKTCGASCVYKPHEHLISDKYIEKNNTNHLNKYQVSS